jgi:parallel beta-helix repeat protein
VAIRGGYAGFGEPDPDARDIRLYETILSGDLKGDDGPGFANNAENSYHVVTANGTDVRAVLDGFTVTCGNANDTYGYGGGMDNRLGRPTVANCTFSGNCGTRVGGLANREYSSLTLTNCVFSGNSGGGMCNWTYSASTLTNCTFSGNTGGAMNITKGSETTLKNCTLAGNQASAIHCVVDCSATVVNTILWGNSPSEIWLEDSSITVTYSDVQGGWPGIGNINADPLFANPRSGDYHLKSQAGRWDPARQVWIQDNVTSPCIDAGDPSSPVALEPSPNGGIVNMGAYGGTAEASKSPSGLHAKLPVAVAHAGYDVTKLGDTVIGVPNDGDWLAAEAPPLAVDDNVYTKYLHFKGDFYPSAGPTGLRITPSVGPTVVTGLTFTAANDYPGRDPDRF